MEFPSLRFISSVKDILVLFEHSSRRLDSSSHFRMDNNLPGSQFREVHIAWSWPASREKMPCLQRDSFLKWQHSNSRHSSTSPRKDSIHHQDRLEVKDGFTKLFTTFKMTCSITLLGLGQLQERGCLTYTGTVCCSGSTVPLWTAVPVNFRTASTRTDWKW